MNINFMKNVFRILKMQVSKSPLKIFLLWNSTGGINLGNVLWLFTLMDKNKRNNCGTIQFLSKISKKVNEMKMNFSLTNCDVIQFDYKQ